VATRKALARPLEVFYFLTNMVPQSGSILMNPVLLYDKTRKEERVTPEEWIEFLGTIFPVWWENRQRYPVVNPFQGYLDKVLSDPENKVASHVAGCVWNEVNISPGGEASQCGRASDWDLLAFGNIMDRPLADADAKRQQLEDRLSMLEAGDCKGCPYWGLCSGGCPLDAWSEHGDFIHRSPWCESTRGFLEKYFEPLTGLRFGTHGK
jgi:radical SAM protein with 4Fe4S-binding SPASM domain